MKSFTILSAFAAGATATFIGANPFKCPANYPNRCTPKQQGGYDFGDLEPNQPPKQGYNGFDWKGFTCKSGPQKRDRLGRRTFGGNFLGAECGRDNSPSFGVQPGNPDFDDFSLSEIHVSAEYDTDLEFHYDMPDGSKCKHRAACGKTPKKIKNDQCGGAKQVSIVYPSQPNKPKPTCSIGVHSMSFSCVTKPPPKPTKPTKPPTFTPPPPPTTTPGTSESSTKPVESSPPPPPPPPPTTTTKPTENTPPPPPPPTTYPPTTIVSSYFSTSTVTTVITSTYIGCPPEVPFCPGGNGTATTVVTSVVSTTLCPVTETYTTIPTYTTVPTDVPTTKQTTETSNSPTDTTTYIPTDTTTYIPTDTTTYVPTLTTSQPPKETLPCPSVVPQCLNTFLFLVSCADNSDHHCYCPDKVFIESIMTCVYAHGETDTVIQEAVVFLQGLCAPYIPVNPGIVTCASVTSYVTPTVTVTVPAVYTTQTYEQTITVPCTGTDGVEIPGSSTVTYISTAITYPQVGLTTGPTGGVGFIPVATPQAQLSAVPTGVSKPTGGAGAGGSTGTGSFTPGRPTNVVTAGAARNGAAALAGVAVAVVAALL